MIGWFPTPYPDELFYSLCARYSAVYKLPRQLDLSQELFSKERFKICLEFPTSLGDFVSRLPGNSCLTPERIISEHTLLPFYAPFLPTERVNKLKRIMVKATGVSGRSFAGGVNSNVSPPSSLRFCPKCSLIDKQLYGETYWHRIHQLSGIEVCTKHLVFLENSSVALTTLKDKIQPLNAEHHIHISEIREMDLTDSIHQCLLHLAKDAEWLLENTNICPGYDYLKSNYLNILHERELLTKSGKTDLKQLYILLRERYPREFLQTVQNDFDETKGYNWLARFLPRLTQDQVHTPLRHLLLIHALEHSPQSFFGRTPRQLSFPKYVFTDSYFIQGPYPCLNPVCKKYFKPCVKNFHVKKAKHSYYFTLHVICDCGFYYTRKGPDKQPADLYRKDYIRHCGELWEQALIRLWADLTKSVRQISKILNTNNSFVKNNALALGLKFPRKGSHSRRIFASKESQKIKRKRKIINEQNWEKHCHDRRENRKLWLKALKENPQASRTRLKQKILPKVANWLKKNDKEWIESNQPEKAIVSQYVKRVNWLERDKNLSLRIEEAARQIKLKSGRPLKVTTNSIIRELGETDWKFRINSKMPITHAKLKEVVESGLEFQLRKIQYAVNIAKSKPEPTSFSKIANLTAASEYLKFPEVQEAIRKGVQEINNNLHLI
jgi:hypothetical protein